MQIKHFLISALLALIPLGEMFADEVEVIVGTGTSTSYNTPFCNYYKHGAVQIIYPASDMSGAGTIKSIAFQVASAKEYATTGVNIYMGHKSTSTFTDKTDIVPFSDLTLVYSGTPTLGSATGWEEYTLNTPFVYNGTNLIVAIEKHATSYDSSLNYNYTYKSNSVLLRQNDSNSEYGDFTKSYDFSTDDCRPNVRFNMEVESVTINGITYNCASGIASAISASTELTSDVLIPETITSNGKTYTVTSLSSNLFKDNTTITSVSIPSTVTSIGDYAFYGCKALTSLTIPASVRTLGMFSFYNCSGIKELTIEDSSEPLSINNGSQGFGMFRNSPLSKLYLGRDLEYNNAYYSSPFYNKTNEIKVTIGSKVTILGNYLFYSGTGLKSIMIPSNVESIGEKAFYGCTNLAKVVNGSKIIKATVGSEDNGYVAYYANNIITAEEYGTVDDFIYVVSNGVKIIYEYNGSDTEIIIPEGYEMSSELFKDRTEITSVTLPEGITAISDYCFDGCKNLKKFTIPSSVKTIGKYAFSRTGMEEISIPSNVKTLGDHAFYRCDSLASLIIAEGSISRIEDFTFCYCRKIVDVHVPASVNYFGRGAFYECVKLETINIPEGVTRLGCFAFKNCIKLKEIIVPESVDSIEMHTFYYCRSMTKAQMPSNLKHIGSCAFDYCYDLVDFEIPSTVTYIGNMAFKSCSDLPSITIPEGIEYLGMEAFSSCSSLKSVVIPSCITHIPYSLFSGCYNLKSVQLPENLTDIDDCAFSGCAINSINWPSTLKSVGYLAFSGSSNMKTAVVPKANEYGKLILSGNSPMNKVYCFADIILPDSVFRIDAIYNTTLYVKPSMLEAYRASQWASRFKSILPIGDFNGDGKYNVTDISLMVNEMNGVELPPFNNYRLTTADVTGDGKFDASDMNEVLQHVLNNEVITPFVPLPAEEPKPVTQLVPSDDCTVLYTIASYDPDTRLILDYINEIRYEACIEGVSNPSKSNTYLKESDYVPIRWSTDLERCARVRCAESLYTCMHHSRLNGKGIGTVTSNGVSAGTENLGWGYYGSVLGSINGYYEEKNDLVYKTGDVVGHYTNLIDPTHLFIGVSALGSCSATETWSRDISDKESYFLPPTGVDTIRLDVKTSYIDSYRVGTTSSINNQSVNTGTHQQLAIFAHITPYSNAGGYLIMPNAGTFVSSDPEIASIDEKGTIYFKTAGTVTVTGYLDGEEKDTRTYTVSCSHDYYYNPLENNKTTGVCSKCGNETSVGLPTYLQIYWNNSMSGSSSYSYLPSKNPVGSYLKPWIYATGGTYPYDTVLVTNDRPDLLETTETASSICSWLVKGVGVAHVTFTCKYNPSITRTYTINLTEPEVEESTEATAKRRIASPKREGVIIAPEETPSVGTEDSVKKVETKSIVL